MADDYSISAKITADASGYEAGVKKAQKASQTLSKSISGVIQGLGKSGLVGALGAVGLATGGVVAILGTVKKAFQAVSKAVNECTEKYKTQYLAEVALETAVNNSPYVDGTATKALKDFASQIQRTSDIGDEEILPMMTKLIASGRTEAEVMKIVATATDMSATGTISFETAITQLNQTLTGSIGRLGVQYGELKALTEEELKSGKALDILASKYNGVAQSTIDTSKQLKNAIGDFKELIGKSFEDNLAPMRKFFTEVITNVNSSISSAREMKSAMDDVFKGDNTVNLNAQTANLKQVLDDTINQLGDAIMNYNQYLDLYGKYIDKTTDETALAYQKDIESLKKLAQEINNELLARQGETQAQKKAREEAEKRAQKEKEIADLKDEYLKKIAEQERKWGNIEDVTEKAVSNEEKIKFYQDALVDLMTKANGEITTENDLYKRQIKIIEKLQEGISTPAEEKKTGNEWEKKIREQMIARLEADKEEKLAEVENEKHANLLKEKLTVEYNEQIKTLKLEALAFEEQEALKSVEDLQNAEEEKARIREYYENERFDLILSYAKENKKAGEISAQSFADGFKSVVKKLTPIMKEIGKVLSSIGNIAKSMFQGGVSIFTKLFNIDMGTVLDAILKIEDKVLTFFVETLPKLPQFVASVMQSISVLLESVLQVVTPERISEIIISIMDTIGQYAPTIIGAIADILSNMLDGIINSLPQILDTLNVVVEKLAEVLPQLIQKLIDLFIGILQNPEKIAQLVVTIIKGIVEIFNVLLRNIGPLLEALLPAIGTIIIELIKAIPDILTSMAEALWEAIKGIGKFIVNMIIDVLNLMFDGISKAWTWIPGTKGIPHIPKLATGTDNAQRGIALVGEAGPELVRFNGGEQVLNNRNTQKALAGIGNSGNTFNVTFNNTQDTTAYAMMSQLKQYNRQMAINGVI